MCHATHAMPGVEQVSQVQSCTGRWAPKRRLLLVLFGVWCSWSPGCLRCLPAFSPCISQLHCIKRCTKSFERTDGNWSNNSHNRSRGVFYACRMEDVECLKTFWTFLCVSSVFAQQTAVLRTQLSIPLMGITYGHVCSVAHSIRLAEQWQTISMIDDSDVSCRCGFNADCWTFLRDNLRFKSARLPWIWHLKLH